MSSVAPPPQFQRAINVLARRNASLEAEGKHFQHPSLNIVGGKNLLLTGQQ